MRNSTRRAALIMDDRTCDASMIIGRYRRCSASSAGYAEGWALCPSRDLDVGVEVEAGEGYTAPAGTGNGRSRWVKPWARLCKTVGGGIASGERREAGDTRERWKRLVLF